MATLRWTGEAADSLREIHDYIARDRPTTAARTVESIVNKVDSLLGGPELGHHYPYACTRPIRVLAYGHFRIAYLADEPGDVVILGVFHGLIFLPLK